MLVFYRRYNRRQTLRLERTGIKKRDKFLRWDNSCPLIRFEVKQVFITGDEVVRLCLACTDQKFVLIIP